MCNFLLALKPRIVSLLVLLFLSSVANANLVLNGDFENGDQNFITDYTLGIGAGVQRYNVTTDPRLHHGSAASYGDHTSGAGNMIAFNAATAANQLVWGQEISLAANTSYKFSVWVSSWYPLRPANIKFNIGGISLGSVVASSDTGIWEQYSFAFNSGATSGPSLLSIVDTTRVSIGDDFALDDISVSTVPLPAAAWLFLSSLVIFRFKKMAIALGNFF